MSYSNIPIASAKPLPLLHDDSDRQNDNSHVVVQAHVDENNVFASSNSNSNDNYYNYSEPTIAVPASDVMVQPAPKPMQQLAQPPTMTLTTNDNQLLQQAIMDPRIRAFKQRRKRRQAFAAATGFVAGTILVGPIMGVVTGAVVHGAVKAGGRARQRRMEQRLQQQEGRGVC